MKTPLPYLALCGLLLVAAVPPAIAASKAPKQETVPDASKMTPQQIAARRAALAKIIDKEQAIMTRYEKQTSFDQKSHLTEAQYKAAKVKRDAAQKERDELAAR